MLTLRCSLWTAALLALPLSACDRAQPPAPQTESGPVAASATAPQAPAGHAEVWAQYLDADPAAATDDAGWVVDGAGLPGVHLDAMRVHLATTFNAKGWALARSADGTRYKLVADFATSGEALKMLNWDATGTRYSTLAAFDPPAETVVAGTQKLANELIDWALTRLNVVRTQADAYAATHGGAAPDLSAGWDALTRSQPPLLTQAPVNPLTRSAHVAAAPGPEVGWVQTPDQPLRLSVPQAWLQAYPQLSADAAGF